MAKVSQSEFARLVGVSRQRISALVSDGKIETKKGKIDSISAKRALKSLPSGNHRKGELAICEQDVESTVDLNRLTTEELKELKRSTFDQLEDVDGDEVTQRLNRARMLREEERARLAEINRLEAEGRLVPIDFAEAVTAEHYERFKAQILTLPGRLSGRLVGMTDQIKIRDLLDEELRECLIALTFNLSGEKE